MFVAPSNTDALAPEATIGTCPDDSDIISIVERPTLTGNRRQLSSTGF